MFAGLGIDAVPALVSTSGQRLVAEMLPSPGVFNHVIVRWRDGDRIRWLDPTATHQRGPLASRYVPDYGFALLVAPGVTALQTIPVDPGVGWQVHVDERIQLAAKPADNRLEVRSRYNGVWAESMRARVGTVPEAEWQRDYSNYYARLYREATSIAAATVRDSSNENQLTVTEQYRLPRLLEESIPLTAETIANFVASPTDVQRSSPLALTYPAHAIHEIRLEHPADFELQLADAPIQVENDFLRYSRTVTRQAGTVVVRQEYSTKQQSVPSQHLPEYLDGLRRIRDAMYVDAVVVQGASTADKSIDRTAERLERIRALINGHGPAPAATEKK